MKSLKTLVRANIEAYQEAYILQTGQMLVFKISKDKVNGVTVQHSSRVVRAALGNPAIFGYLPGFMAQPDFDVITIPDDEDLAKYPSYVQDFLYLHEVGHIKLHKGKVSKGNLLKRLLISALGKVQDLELEADAYSANIVGKEVAIESLKWLLEQDGYKGNKEILNRIKALS